MIIKEDFRLINSLFFNSFIVFFLSVLTSSLGILVDGIVVGRAMSSEAIAVFGLISPLNFAIALIGFILSSGLSNVCARYLGRNEADRARTMFSMTCMAGFGLSFIAMILPIVFSDSTILMLGSKYGTETYYYARSYLIFFMPGLPAITGIKLLTSIMHLDGDRNRAFYSTIVMIMVNTAGDLLCVYVFHTGLAAIAFTSTVSYYVGLIVLLLHFRKRNIIFRFSLKNTNWKEFCKEIFKGLPVGISRITSTIRGIYINRVLIVFSTIAVAGFSMQSSLNYMLNAVIMGIAQSFMMIFSVYYGEQNRSALLKVTKISCLYELILTGTSSLLLFYFAPVVTRLFFAGNLQLNEIGIISIRIYSTGLLFQGFNILFADSLQLTGKTMMANMVYIFEDVLFVVIAVGVLSRTHGMIGAFIGVSAAHVIMFFFIFVVVIIKNKKMITSLGDFLMLNPDLGVAPENELLASIKNLADINIVLDKLEKFCHEKGVDRKRVYAILLSTEEMSHNIVQHGFNDGKKHAIDIRILYKNDELTLIIRDDCRQFDPKERYKYLSKNSDDTLTNFGIKMTMHMAKEVTYTSTLKLNNLIVKV